MARYQIQLFISSLLLLLSCQVHTAEAISRCNQHLLASASINPRYSGSYRQRSPLLKASSSRRSTGSDYGNRYAGERTLLVSRTKKESKKSKEKSRSKKNDPAEDSEDPFATPMSTQDIYAGLGPVGRVVAGTTEIAVATCLEYITGFMGGYFLGSLTDFPRFVAKNAQEGQRLPFMQELSQRYVRMHGKSFRWAKNWGGISAAFGGFRVATRVIRGGKDDEWNTIISSAAAGAFFARNEGPQGMLRGAVTYGGMMYVFSGGLGAKKNSFDYKEEPVDF